MSHTTKTSSQTSLKSHRLQFRCAVRGRIARFDVIEVDDVLDVAEVELGFRPDRTRLSQLMNGRDWEANGRSTALCIRALGLFGITPEWQRRTMARIRRQPRLEIEDFRGAA